MQGIAPGFIQPVAFQIGHERDIKGQALGFVNGHDLYHVLGGGFGMFLSRNVA